MANKRMIHESITWSDDIDKLSAFEETVFYRLIVCVDDNGRIDARPNFLKSKLFVTKLGITVQSIEDALMTLASVGLVRFYEVDRKPFLLLPKWTLYQKLQYVKECYPGPEESEVQSKQNAEEADCKSKKPEAMSNGYPEEAPEQSSESEEAEAQSMDTQEEAKKQSTDDECTDCKKLLKISKNSKNFSEKIKNSALEVEEEVELEVEAEREVEDKSIDQSANLVPRHEVTFSEFWASYPKKVGKRPCQRKWEKLNPGEGLFIKIMQSLEAQKRSRQWTSDGGRYVPNPLTWINQERWNDVLEPARQRGSIGTIQDALAELERMEHDQA